MLEALRGTGRLNTAQMILVTKAKATCGFITLAILRFKRPSVAIVGTREVSEAGITRTKRLARELVEIRD